MKGNLPRRLHSRSEQHDRQRNPSKPIPASVGSHSGAKSSLQENASGEYERICPRRNALLKEGNKTDKVDARKLADLLRTGMLRPVYHGEHGLRTLRELVRAASHDQ